MFKYCSISDAFGYNDTDFEWFQMEATLSLRDCLKTGDTFLPHPD